MTVKTKKVQGRRTVRYESYDELLADAGRLAGGNVRMLGNWSLGQNFKHIAMALDSAIDGTGFVLPSPVRWIVTLLMKQKFLHKSISSGFKTTAKFVPDEISTEAGLEMLRESIARQGRESERALHPAFGKLSAAEWNLFNLRHAEMHLSFAVPESD